MNPAWVKGAAALISRLQQQIKELERRVAELENKRGPGRPPKEPPSA
jgi:hypothetical protein